MMSELSGVASSGSEPVRPTTFPPELTALWRLAMDEYTATTGIGRDSPLWTILTQTKTVQDVLVVADDAWSKFLNPAPSGNQTIPSQVAIDQDWWDDSQAYQLFLGEQDISSLRRKFQPKRYESYRNGMEAALAALDILEQGGNAANLVPLRSLHC